MCTESKMRMFFFSEKYFSCNRMYIDNEKQFLCGFQSVSAMDLKIEDGFYWKMWVEENCFNLNLS